MRQIPVLLADGQFDPCIAGIVQAHMQFPDDEASIEEDIAAWRMRHATGFRTSNLGRHLNGNWDSAKIGGLFAGGMLMMMIQFDQHFPEMKVGMNKSAFAWALAAKNYPKPLKKEMSTIKRYWAEYKNAANLWAALSLEFLATGSKPPLDFASILGNSEHIVRLGTHLVEEWCPWRAPPGVPIAATFDVDPPSPQEVALVRKYAA